MTVLTEKLLFSIYGVSIEHPKNWKIFFSPKRNVDYSSGFFRIEDYIPKKGAQLSLSINWEKAPGDNESFAHQYCSNLTEQYEKQLKKTPHQIETMEVVDFQGGKAAYVVLEYKASPGLVKKKSDAPVRILQLAFYDEVSGRAVVSSIMGRPETVMADEDFFLDLVFSVKSSPGQPVYAIE